MSKILIEKDSLTIVDGRYIVTFTRRSEYVGVDASHDDTYISKEELTELITALSAMRDKMK